ncbi:hypothetical protein [Streptomyces sp. NPDC050848]|uniref:hypothetical protein n=1 Tax=Streptomyces sp. NPDC050848 TaxID=3155791 RepID=UPI0033CEE4E7
MADDDTVHTADRVVRDIALWAASLVRQFPELAEELAPGRRSPAGTPPTAPHPGRDELIREERREALLLQQRHGLAVPGHGAAPIRLHVSDAIRDISDGVVELEEAVCARLGLPRPRRAGVIERLRRVVGLLDDLAPHPDLARHVRDEIRRMARRCARTLGDTETVVRVAGRCPWCDSVSLRVFPDRRAVLCVNPACVCTDEVCGCQDDPAYRHLWPEERWGELADASGARTEELEAALNTTASTTSATRTAASTTASNTTSSTASNTTSGTTSATTPDSEDTEESPC